MVLAFRQIAINDRVDNLLPSRHRNTSTRWGRAISVIDVIAAIIGRATTTSTLIAVSTAAATSPTRLTRLHVDIIIVVRFNPTIQFDIEIVVIDFAANITA